jgi:hypothetical protein
MPLITEITEIKDKEMIKKLMSFLQIESLVKLKEHTHQQIIGMLNKKEEIAQKEIQAQRQEFLAKLSTLTQKEWEESFDKEEKKEQELIEKIVQSKTPPVVLAKTTDGTEENTSCFLTISPEEQEKTIQIINQAYQDTTSGTTHPPIESKRYENIEKFKQDEPNLTLPEPVQRLFNQNKILLEIRTFMFTPNQFTDFKSHKDIQALINDKKIHLVEDKKIHPDHFVYAQCIFFQALIPSRTSKNAEKDPFEEKPLRFSSPGG